MIIYVFLYLLALVGGEFLPKCREEHLYGVKPEHYSYTHGGDLNVLVARAFTIREKGYLVGWQLYNNVVNTKYFVDIFRPVPGQSRTYDMVHFIEVASVQSGHRTVILPTPFQVKIGDNFGVHINRGARSGISRQDPGVQDWPMYGKSVFHNTLQQYTKVSFRICKGRKFALRAVVVKDKGNGKLAIIGIGKSCIRLHKKRGILKEVYNRLNNKYKHIFVIWSSEGKH